jgi:hypothetical protein
MLAASGLIGMAAVGVMLSGERPVAGRQVRRRRRRGCVAGTRGSIVPLAVCIMAMAAMAHSTATATEGHKQGAGPKR